LAAIEHYQALGKLQFVFVDDLLEQDPNVTSLGYEHASAGLRWIVRRDAVPGWLSFVAEIFKIQFDKRPSPPQEIAQSGRAPAVAAG
jgi:hypothetical protein